MEPIGALALGAVSGLVAGAVVAVMIARRGSRAYAPPALVSAAAVTREQLIQDASERLGVTDEVIRKLINAARIDVDTFVREKQLLMAWKGRHPASATSNTPIGSDPRDTSTEVPE